MHTVTRRQDSSVHFSSSVLALQPVILTTGGNGSGLGPEKVFLINWVLGLNGHRMMFRCCSQEGRGVEN